MEQTNSCQSRREGRTRWKRVKGLALLIDTDYSVVMARVKGRGGLGLGRQRGGGKNRDICNNVNNKKKERKREERKKEGKKERKEARKEGRERKKGRPLSLLFHRKILSVVE